MKAEALEDTRKLADNLRVYRSLSTIADSALAGERFDEAVLWTQLAARYAGLYNPGFFQLTDAERRLVAIKNRCIPSGNDGSPPSGLSSTGAFRGRESSGERGRVLHVITEGHDVGGHTRAVCRWLDTDPRSSTIVFTKSLAAPSMLEESAERAGAPIVALQGPPISRARHLREMALGFDFVVLTILTFDTVPTLAFGCDDEVPPVLLFNQGDYVPWLGVCATNVLVNARNVGQRLSTERRLVPIEHQAILPSAPTPIANMEISIEQRREMRRAASIENDEVILLTVATGYKHFPYRGLSLPHVVHPVLRAHPNVKLVAVGMDDWYLTPAWETLRADFGSRVLLRPSSPVPDEVYWLSDIYLDPIPCGSALSAIDASFRGLPVVALNINSALGILEEGDVGWGVTGIEAPGFKEHHVMAGSLGEYETALTRLIEDADHRFEMGMQGRQDLLDLHTGPAWVGKLEEIYAQATRVGKIPLAERPEPNFGPAEKFLADLCDHSRWGIELAVMIADAHLIP